MGILHFRRIERRRTARVPLCVNLTVHGETENKGKFKAEAQAVCVSKHGGMMELGREVLIGQRLLLIHMVTGEQAECKVVSLMKPERNGNRNVAFEFTADEINFWRMCFPRPGAKPLRRVKSGSVGLVPAAR
jgi:hypothetical protein